MKYLFIIRNYKRGSAMRLNNHDKPKNNECSGKKSNKESPVKTILWITLACLLAAGLYFGGRIAYFGFVDPRSAFDTTQHTKSPSVSPAVAAPAQTTVQATPIPTPSTVAQQDTEEPEGDIDAPEDDPANQPLAFRNRSQFHQGQSQYTAHRRG